MRLTSTHRMPACAVSNATWGTELAGTFAQNCKVPTNCWQSSQTIMGAPSQHLLGTCDPLAKRVNDCATTCHTQPQRGPQTALGVIDPSASNDWHPWQMPIKSLDIPGHKNLLCSTCHTAGRVPKSCLLYTSPSPRDRTRSRMPSSA